MSKSRLLLPAFAIFIGALPGEPSNLNGAFAQSVEESARLSRQEPYGQGRYAEAEPLIKRALAIREQAVGLDHPDVAESLNNLAELYKLQGRYAGAEPLDKRSLTEKALSHDASAGANQASRCANTPTPGVILNQRRYFLSSESFEVQEDVEGLIKQKYGLSARLAEWNDISFLVNPVDIQKFADGIGLTVADQRHECFNVFMTLNHLSGPDGRRRYLIARHNGVLPRQWYAVAQIGGNYIDLGRWTYPSQALVTLPTTRIEREDGAIPQIIAPETSSGRALPLGAGSESVPVFEDIKADYFKFLVRGDPNTKQDQFQTLMNEIQALSRINQIDEAALAAKRMLHFAERNFGMDSTAAAIAADALAELGLKLENFEESEAFFLRAIEILTSRFGEHHLSVALELCRISELYFLEGNVERSKASALRAQALLQTLSARMEGAHRYAALAGLVRLPYIMALNGERTGPADEVREHYQSAVSLMEKFDSLTSPGLIPILNSFGEFELEQRDWIAARSLFERAFKLTMFSHGEKHHEQSKPLNKLAEIAFMQKRQWDAINIIRRLVEASWDDSATLLPLLDSMKGSQDLSEDEALKTSFEVIQRHQKSSVAVAANQLYARFSAGDSELARLIRQLQDYQAERVALEKSLTLAMMESGQRRRLDVEAQMSSRMQWLSGSIAKTEGLIESHFPSFAELSKPSSLGLEETKEQLLDDEALLLFSIDPGGSYVWGVSRTRAAWAKLQITSQVLTDQVSRLRQSLTFENDEAYDALLAYTIYKETFEPIVQIIAGKKRLSIVTNGALTAIPFGILITSDPNGKSLKSADWLIRSYAVTILPSVYSLKTMRGEAVASTASKPMIAFADPVFSKEARPEAKATQVAMRSLSTFYRGSQLNVQSLAESLPQLPGTRMEVEAIAESLKASKDDLRLGLDASEKAVKESKLDDYRIVYFATHGLVAGELQEFAKAKAEPALVFTLPDKPSDLDDGLLQASEIAELKLDADWVVLSACNTASSHGVGAEPLSGLARAFIYAGGKSLVVSHWDVSDEATARLMSNLFEISKDKPDLSHGEMMRQATLSLLDAAATDEDAHPRVWAPFVVVGEPARAQ